MLESHAADLIAYLKQEGISLNQVIQLPHSFDTSALIKGTADAMSAYSTDEPFYLEKAGVRYLTFTPRAGGIDFYGDTLFTTEGQIKTHPKRVKAFLEASLKGWRYALDHPDEMIDLIRQDYSQRHSREHLEFEAKMTRRLVVPDVIEIGYMNPGRWQFIVDAYTSLGMAPKQVNLKGFIYDRNPSPNFTWFYLTLTGSLSLLGIVTWIALKFYRLNDRIRQEVKERVRTESALRKLETRYRNMVEHAPFPIVISRLESGEICYINPAAATKLDIAQEYAPGQNARSFYLNPDDRATVMEILKRRGFVEDFEVQLLTAAGKPFWASMALNLTEFEGKPALFVAVMDISDRKRLAQKMETLAMTDDLTTLYTRQRSTV